MPNPFNQSTYEDQTRERLNMNELQTKPQAPATKSLSLRDTIGGDYFKKQVALALPKHMTPDRFVRVGLTALMKTPKLLDCTQESVIQCLLNCSSLGLEPDGRRAHLIPYGNTCTLIVDYKGIVELAKRSGDVSNVFAQIVCANDNFEWENGEVTHKIDFRTPRGEMYAAYATITFKDGTKQSDVMTKDEIDAIRKRSKSGQSGPWLTDYNEMAKKTVFRRASKWITLSPEVSDALEAEDDLIKPAIEISTEPAVKQPVFNQLETPAARKPRQSKPAEVVVSASVEPAAPTPVVEPAKATEPSIESLLLDEAPAATSPSELNLRAAIAAAGITEAQVLAFCVANKINTVDGNAPESLSQLATVKMDNLTKNISNPASPILAKIKAG